jgi:hypothetical protein
MSQDRCIPTETLLRIAGGESDPAERAHLEACPRCRAELLALRAFVAPAALPDSARAAEADAALDRFIDELTGVDGERQAAAPRALATTGPAGWSRWFVPGPRMALAAAVLAVVVAGVWIARPPAPERAHTRGATMGTSDDATGVSTAEPAAIPGGWLLEWKPVPEATRYEVVLFGPDLVERGRIDAGSATHLALTAASVPAAGDTAGPLVWQVEALRGSDVVARSSVAELPRP